MNKKLAIAITLAAGLALGSLAGVHAKLPAPPAKTDEQKKAEAEKAAAAKAKDAEALAKAQDRVVAHYKKSKGIAMDTKAAKAPEKKK
jgi:hypothetical protein